MSVYLRINVVFIITIYLRVASLQLNLVTIELKLFCYFNGNWLSTTLTQILGTPIWDSHSMTTMWWRLMSAKGTHPDTIDIADTVWSIFHNVQPSDNDSRKYLHNRQLLHVHLLPLNIFHRQHPCPSSIFTQNYKCQDCMLYLALCFILMYIYIITSVVWPFCLSACLSVSLCLPACLSHCLFCRLPVSVFLTCLSVSNIIKNALTASLDNFMKGPMWYESQMCRCFRGIVDDENIIGPRREVF